jgi:Secretion system C-terminal sorting domain
MKKISIAIFLMFVLHHQLMAQTNANLFDWAFNTGGGYNNLQRINYDSKGNLFFLASIGDSTNFGTPIKAAGYSGYPGTVRIIGKYTQAGVKSIVVHGPTNNNFITTFYDFSLDGNDNIIVSGVVFNATTPYDFGNGVTLLGKGFFVAKFNSSGVAQWAKLYDMGVVNSSTTKPVALGILPNNDIYFAATNPNGTAPFWLARINTSGTELWHKEWLMGSFSTSNLLQSSKNNLFIDNAGTAYFYVESTSNYLALNADTVFAPAGAHPSTAYILSIDANGNNKLLTGYRGGIGDIAVDKSTGNVFVKWGQYLQNPAPFNTINANANNQYQGVVVIDSNRNYVKSTPNNFLLAGDINSIFPLGGFSFMGGNELQATVSINAGTQTFTASKQTFAYKFYDNNMVFSKFVAHPECNDVSATTSQTFARFDNKLAVGGEYLLANNATININGTVLTTCEHNPNFGIKYPNWATLAGDLFIGQLTIGVATLPNALAENKQVAYSIYPNPTNDGFYIDMDMANYNNSLKILDVTGKTVSTYVIKANHQYINCNLTAGVYFVQVLDSNKLLSSKKLIIQ